MYFFKHPLIREILGIVFISLAIFLLLSLVSYNPADPSFNHTGGQNLQNIHNLAGRFGAYFADTLLDGFGIIAFFLPVVFIFIGIGLIRLRNLKYSISQCVGVFFLVISGCGLFSFSTRGLVTKMFGRFFFGGLIGMLVHKILAPNFNTMGAWIILLTTLSVSLILVTQTSIYDLIFLVREKTGLGLGFLRNWSIFEKEGLGFGRRKNMAKSDKSFTKKSFKGKAKGRCNELKTDEDKEFDQILASFKGPLPPITILEQPEKTRTSDNKLPIQESSKKLEEKLLDFGVQGKVVQVHTGPVVTRYEFEPAPGIKISKITNLSDDLALAMKALSVRILAPVPGKSVVGLELPNQYREKVYLREILESDTFSSSHSRLSLALGKDIAGTPYVTDLAKMPHLLLAGTTGSGKSVSVNAIICSILFNAMAEEVKFIMIDPKMLELGIYNAIPHLLTQVVVDPKEAANALRWATQEMENRYRLLAKREVRNIEQYNKMIISGEVQPDVDIPIGEDRTDAEVSSEEPLTPLPYIVIVIDEFADLMIMSAREVETLLIRLAQMARAVGIHLIIATQRPSVDIVTGLIKANFPCRISFRVSSKTDSRTILDANGAERLLGHGDMLFLAPNSSEAIRLHGSFITEVEIKRLVKYLSSQGKPQYNASILSFSGDDGKSGSNQEEEGYDDLYDQAVDLVIKTRQASISMIQRRLRIGYNRAARMIEFMEKEGVVSKPQGSKPREVLVGSEYER